MFSTKNVATLCHHTQYRTLRVHIDFYFENLELVAVFTLALQTIHTWSYVQSKWVYAHLSLLVIYRALKSADIMAILFNYFYYVTEQKRAKRLGFCSKKVSNVACMLTYCQINVAFSFV